MNQGWVSRLGGAARAFDLGDDTGETYALTCMSRQLAIWSDRTSLVAMSDMVDLGIVVYAAGASLVEVIVRMAFYALEQRKKRIEQRKKELEIAREEAMREGRDREDCVCSRATGTQGE